VIYVSPLRESRSFRLLWFCSSPVAPYLGQVESGVVAKLVSPVFSVVSGGAATLLSVVGVALWAPEVISYRAPAPQGQGPLTGQGPRAKERPSDA
jgi:hypothetical protein